MSHTLQVTYLGLNCSVPLSATVGPGANCDSTFTNSSNYQNCVEDAPRDSYDPTIIYSSKKDCITANSTEEAFHLMEPGVGVY
jgi:hypothetical protein